MQWIFVFVINGVVEFQHLLLHHSHQVHIFKKMTRPFDFELHFHREQKEYSFSLRHMFQVTEVFKPMER